MTLKFSERHHNAISIGRISFLLVVCNNNVTIQSRSKSKLLILSEYVNKTEKIGGM